MAKYWNNNLSIWSHWPGVTINIDPFTFVNLFPTVKLVLEILQLEQFSINISLVLFGTFVFPSENVWNKLKDWVGWLTAGKRKQKRKRKEYSSGLDRFCGLSLLRTHIYILKLNPKFHWLRQIATTLYEFHWRLWIIFWMQSPKLKN